VADFPQPKKGAHLELAYLHGGEVLFRPGESLQPRVLSDFELVYIIEGQVDYTAGGITYTVAAGGFIFGRPGVHETYWWDAGIALRHAYFHFGIEYYPSVWPDPANWSPVRSGLSPVCSSLFLHILQHIYEHPEWPAVRPRPKDCHLVEVLIDTMLENHQLELTSFERDRPEPVRHALMCMRKQIEENPRHVMTLAEAAQWAKVSEKHLCRLFTLSVGTSPVQTYLLLKLINACPLLIRSGLSVSEIADRCGFDNPAYFSRRFSQVYGCSPTVFREQVRSGKMIPKNNFLPADLVPRRCW